MEGMDRKYPVNQKALPENLLTDEEQVHHALQHQLEQDAKDKLAEIQNPLSTYEEFLNAIPEFNALPSESRGAERYDHGRPIAEHKDRTITLSSPSGYPYTVTLHKNGEITLSTVLG